MENIKRCGYRNCVHVLIDRKESCKFCSRKCKEYEKIYRKRDHITKKEEDNHILNLLGQYDKLKSSDILNNSDLLSLFEKIRNK